MMFKQFTCVNILKYNFPLMLHIKIFITMQNYSKGARGLSV
jgi:hypothetical protein